MILSSTILGKLFGKEPLKHRAANTYFLDADIVYKPITFRIDEYLIVRKHYFTASELKVGLDPGCRDRGSSDNPKFIVKRELKRYPAGKVKTGAGRRSWRRHRRLRSGGNPLARNWQLTKR